MASGLPPVRVDRERVAHVFDNLVGNALAHTGRGGSITLSAEADGDSVRFAVSDTGEGIAAEHLPHIFEKFYRVPGARSAGGAGLGLAIAREIVAAHGGQIDVASRPGEGTTFTFRLPIAREGDGQAHRAGAIAMSNAKRILIVDDEPNVRLVFRTALESSGYDDPHGRGRGGGPDPAGGLAGRSGPARPPDARDGRHGRAGAPPRGGQRRPGRSSSRRTAASPTPSRR